MERERDGPEGGMVETLDCGQEAWWEDDSMRRFLSQPFPNGHAAQRGDLGNLTVAFCFLKLSPTQALQPEMGWATVTVSEDRDSGCDVLW